MPKPLGSLVGLGRAQLNCMGFRRLLGKNSNYLASISEPRLLEAFLRKDATAEAFTPATNASVSRRSANMTPFEGNDIDPVAKSDTGHNPRFNANQLPHCPPGSSPAWDIVCISRRLSTCQCSI